MATIGVGIIGGGIFAKEEHLPAVLKCNKLSLKAIYSRSLKSAQDTAAVITDSSVKPDLYSDDSGDGKAIQDLLKRDDISAVIIALPITKQSAYIEQAFKAGKHVLAEKPVAPDVDQAKKLIETCREISKSTGGTLAIAENFRFKPAITYAADEAKKFGKVTNFSVRLQSLLKKDNKFYKTSWRTKPEHQGGFLLDAGVHFAAATRLFLTGESKASGVQALTTQLQPYIEPIDTVNAIVRTKSGTSGIYQQSVGSHLQAFVWDVALENGAVKLEGETVTVTPAGGEASVKEFERTTGVSEEVAAWAEAIQAGKPNPLQSPEEALGDLELIEQMFRSAEKDGAVEKLEWQ